jgi:hypothetical protein
VRSNFLAKNGVVLNCCHGFNKKIGSLKNTREEDEGSRGQLRSCRKLYVEKDVDSEVCGDSGELGRKPHLEAGTATQDVNIRAFSVSPLDSIRTD